MSQVNLLESVTCTIAPDPQNPHNDLYHVAVTPRFTQQRPPIVLYMLIDVSGSMCCGGGRTQDGLTLSRIQLVQHSLKTIVSSLESQDKIEIIEYESYTRVVYPLAEMSNANKVAAIAEIDKLYAHGGNNDTAGFNLVLSEADKYDGEGNVNVMIFTDGEPCSPIVEIEQMVTKHLSRNPNYRVSTFAFGYDVNSKLLNKVCTEGNGIYGYIPDCTMVGTIFINYISSLMTNLIPMAKVGDQFLSISNDRKSNVLLSLPKGSPLPPLEFHDGTMPSIPVELNQQEMNEQICRYDVLQLIKNGMENTTNQTFDSASVNDLYTKINQMAEKTPYIESLLIDLCHPDPNHGQVEKAFQSQYFHKWGRHYLLSFARFHELEICGNFKDESLQGYSGDNFAECLEKINEVFLSLPPPKVVSYSNSSSGSTTISMASFYDRNGGCFDGRAKTTLKSGLTKSVKELIKGDVLSNGAVVQCIVKTKAPEHSSGCRVNGVIFTPYHPIKMNGSWVFPIDVVHERIVCVGHWYNVILSNGTSIELNGIEAVSLGHGLTDGILKHEYFGTQACIDALQKYDGFKGGLISVEEPKLERDPQTSLITHYY